MATTTETASTPSTDAGNRGSAKGRTALPLKPSDREKLEQEPRHRGKTYIDDEVVSVIARIAAEQVEGIHQLGASSLRGMISRLGRSSGVEAEVGLKEAAIDLEVVVEFGYPIREVAEELRSVVIETIEATTGRRVIEVNIFVVDVHIPRTEHQVRRRVE